MASLNQKKKSDQKEAGSSLQSPSSPFAFSPENYEKLWSSAVGTEKRTERLLEQINYLYAVVATGFIVLLAMVGTLVWTAFHESASSYDQLLQQVYILQGEMASTTRP